MTDVSNLGKWDRWYAPLKKKSPQPYGDSETYEIGAEFLADCDMIEDWGCGKGWFRTLVDGDRYRGVDGSHTPWADEIADLSVYRSDVDGIFMRHVLEHDYRWASILSGAAASARHRLVVVLFTPLAAKETTEIAFADDPGVPDLSFTEADIREPLEAAGFTVEIRTVDPSPTQYGVETVFLARR